MNINLTPKQEQIVRDELAAGHFCTAEEVIDTALQALVDKEATDAVDAAPNGAQREAVREMLAFVEENYVRLEGLSVKELIREGRSDGCGH